MSERFMLVSLKEDKAKKIAQVIGNPTCTRILDYLAQHEGTESQVAKDLGIPLSTVHYNLQQLVEAKLVLVEEFHYSPKGREVNHYKLANKYIIIAPKEESEGFVQRLKGILPAIIVTAGVAVAIGVGKLFTRSAGMAADNALLMQESARSAADVLPAAAPDALTQAADIAAGTIADAAPVAMKAAVFTGEAVNETVNETVQMLTQPDPIIQVVTQYVPAPQLPWWQQPSVEWFLIGAAMVLVVVIITELVRKR